MEYQLLGESIQIREINEIIKQVAPTDVSVLITGESGTGKEVVANLIHQYSKRNKKPFVIVNCGAIPEGIIESELFGHQKGAFTGAIENREGYFEMADEGTVFLDEIGEMPLSTQVKFLRVLETGEFMRVGGNKKIKVDIRIIAATNRDLIYEVNSKAFREDLFYRLKSVNIYIPPLRERKGDIKILFNHFINSFCIRNNIKFFGIEDDAMDFLLNYSWPGNARELKNFCESIIVLVENKKISLEDVKRNLHSESSKAEKSLAIVKSSKINESAEKDFLFRALLELKSDIIDIKNKLELKEIHEFHSYNDNDFFIPKEKILEMDMNDIEKEVIKYLLENNNWNVEKVSKILKQTSRNIYNKIAKYNLRHEKGY